jgi:DNA-binding response OmpR family regulator
MSLATVLILEDDKLLGSAIEETLNEAAYPTVLVSDGTAAVAHLTTNKVDMIYLDIMVLGPIDGYEVLKQIRMPNSLNKSTPVVMLSNLGQTNEIERATELGANDYLIKANIDLSKLVEFTQNTIGQSAGAPIVKQAEAPQPKKGFWPFKK